MIISLPNTYFAHIQLNLSYTAKTAKILLRAFALVVSWLEQNDRCDTIVTYLHIFVHIQHRYLKNKLFYGFCNIFSLF